MDASQALREMIEATGLTQRQIEARAGQYGGWVGQSLARPRPGADLVATLAYACGYRLELVPTMGGDSIVIGDMLDEGDEEASQDRVAEARALLARACSLLDSAIDSR